MCVRDRVNRQQKSISKNNALYIQCAHRALFIEALDSGLTQVLTSTLILTYKHLTLIAYKIPIVKSISLMSISPNGLRAPKRFGCLLLRLTLLS